MNAYDAYMKEIAQTNAWRINSKWFYKFRNERSSIGDMTK